MSSIGRRRRQPPMCSFGLNRPPDPGSCCCMTRPSLRNTGALTGGSTTPAHADHGEWLGVAVRVLGEGCAPLCDSCGRPELPRRDADEALEVAGELALVREPGPCRDLRQGQVPASMQELLG